MEAAIFGSDGTATEAVVITIPENRERCEESIRKFREDTGTGAKITVLERPNDYEDTRRGCWEAHRRAAEHGATNLPPSVERLVVFEDDFEVETTPEALRSAQLMRAFLDSGAAAPWDVFMMGHAPMRAVTHVADGVVQCESFAYAHAYVLSRSGMEKVANLRYDGQHFDHRMTSVLRETTFGANPPFFSQRDLPTSNGTGLVYRMLCRARNLIGYRRLCRFFAWWHGMTAERPAVVAGPAAGDPKIY